MKIVIEDGKVDACGQKNELIVGLVCYALALLKTGFSERDLKWACKRAVGEYQKEEKMHENNVKTIYSDKDFTIHEINTKNMTKEELKNIITDIINNKM